MRNAMPGAGSKVSGRHAADAGYLVPGRDSGALLQIVGGDKLIIPFC